MTILRTGFLVLLGVFVSALIGPPLHAQPGGTGIGVSLGVTNAATGNAPNPVGVSGKHWLSDRQAVDGMTSFYIGGTDDDAPVSRSGQSYWMLQGDYLFHNFNTLTVGEGYLAVYVGAGGQLTMFENSPDQFDLRGPTGITYLMDAAPVDVFVEVAPTLSVTEPTSLRFDGAIGFRYYFTTSPE